MNACLGRVAGASLDQLERWAAGEDTEDECTVQAAQMALAQWRREHEALKGADGRVSFGSIMGFMRRHAGRR